MTTTTYPISPDSNTLYSLDIIRRIKELQAIDGGARTYDEDYELTELLELEEYVSEHASDVPNWDHGAVLVNEDYIKEYAQKTAESCLSPDALNSWPADCIDWNYAADELMRGYPSVYFMGRTFWIQ